MYRDCPDNFLCGAGYLGYLNSLRLYPPVLSDMTVRQESLSLGQHLMLGTQYFHAFSFHKTISYPGLEKGTCNSLKLLLIPSWEAVVSKLLMGVLAGSGRWCRNLNFPKTNFYCPANQKY